MRLLDSTVLLSGDNLAFVGAASSRDKSDRSRKSRMEAAPTKKTGIADLSREWIGKR